MKSEGLARSGVISLLGSAFAALAALLLTAIVGNALGASGTGLFFQAMGIFTILSQVLRLGTNSGVVRFISEQRAFGRAGAEWRIVLYAAAPVAVLSGIASIAVHVLADALSVWLAAPGEEPALADLLRAMAPFVAAGAVIGVLQIAARMLRGVTAFTLLQSVLLPASRLLTVLLAVSIAGVAAWGAFEAWLWPLPVWLVVTAVVIAGPFVRDFRRRAESTRHTRPGFRGFWRFNAPRSVSSGLETALEWSDVLIVAALASPSAAGVYAVITRAVRAGGVVDKAMRVAVAPTISALLARDEHGASTELHTKVVRAMILLNWPFYLLLIAMGPAVLMIFGEEFVSGWGPMIVLAAAMMFQTACGMLQSILLQGGRSTWQMYNKMLALALSIGGNLLLVPLWGVWGAAFTWLIVVVIDNLIAAFQVHRGMHVRLQPGRLLLPMIVPVVVFGGGGALVNWWAGTGLLTLLVGGFVLCAVYAVVLWLLRRPLHIEALWRKVPIVGSRV
ncbi:polysaccharide biosynthesis C-terminal domain-containing protein [Microbacterium sp. M28]|uniref:lipopolysaccharide biosynthesis protein n=1 Tax=Microbacterium sp. M28 TaxID=2962064 RepID=UPI0021F3CD1A|nr:polysaccharide biosynthesis C-terminal domain-containing protein [Microbacterium sp. M28]UYO96654.1 polysaccharide biosynthesis C-terminal domain-containing protein [Microbacterium sp. M28]